MPQVLVIDDSRLAAVVVERILESFNIDCVHVGSIAELFGLRGKASKLRDLKPDIILLDIMMPEMDGFDVLRKLKARQDTKDIPVIMLTASASERNVMQAIQTGAVGFLAKPISHEKLLPELDKICRNTGCTEMVRALAPYMDKDRLGSESKPEYQAGIADLNYMREILDGDEDIMESLIHAFVDDMPIQVGAISQAIQAGNGPALRRAAHTFKGSVGNFGNPLITEMALELEHMGRDNNLDNAQKVFDELTDKAEALSEALDDWLVKRQSEG